MKKFIIIAAIATILAVFFILDLDQYLTLAGFKANLNQFTSWRASQPFVVSFAFLGLYILVAAFSLPGATVMTLAAGALFGNILGTLIVSFASSIGATAAFLVSRYFLQNAVQARFGDRLKAFNDGFVKDGAYYLLSLRLVPLFPFFIINLLMGLTTISTGTFYWVSQVGMFIGTFVYVNAGTQLANISTLSDVASPRLLFSFTLLGIFPLIAKKFLEWLQRRRLYANWKKPKHFDRNLIVIGAGAAGLVTSYIAAAVKAKVTLIEAHKMGGDCLNYGCVPSKALLKSAQLAQAIRHGERFGLKSLEPSFSFREVMKRIQNIIESIAPHDSIERYTQLGVEVLQGYARIKDPWTVEIALNDGKVKVLTSPSIVIAAGARPSIPLLAGLDEVGYVTSDTLWAEFAQLDSPPAHLVVLGGGPIGCELAQSFARLGSKVTLIEIAPRILMHEDVDVSILAHDSLSRDGVTVLTGHKALCCVKDRDKKTIIVSSSEEPKHIAFDYLLCAVGREARLSGYGLEKLGIETKRTVVTNEYLETLYPNIFAAGDVAGPFQFTHAAAHQAWYAAVNALFGNFKKFKVDYSVVPLVTFIDPEVARVGLNEQQAKEKNIPHEITRYGIDDLDRAIADGTAYGFIKVLTVPGKDRILGVTIVGEHAGDLLAEFVLAMKHGLGLNKILATIHSYPTFSEANKYVAGEWKRAHAPDRVLAWVEKYHTWRRG